MTNDTLTKDAQKFILAESDRKKLDEAYRMRAGMIGALGSCICTFPVEMYQTPTGHHEICPAHAIELYHRAQASETGGVVAEPVAVEKTVLAKNVTRNESPTCALEDIANAMLDVANAKDPDDKLRAVILIDRGNTGTCAHGGYKSDLDVADHVLRHLDAIMRANQMSLRAWLATRRFE